MKTVLNATMDRVTVRLQSDLFSKITCHWQFRNSAHDLLNSGVTRRRTKYIIALSLSILVGPHLVHADDDIPRPRY